MEPEPERNAGLIFLYQQLVEEDLSDDQQLYGELHCARRAKDTRRSKGIRRSRKGSRYAQYESDTICGYLYDILTKIQIKSITI